MSSTIAEHGVAIAVCNVGKCYRMYPHPWHHLRDLLSRPSPHTDFWALRSVTFELRRGQIAGLVGRNGSGKTTLLQILTGILRPSTGRAAVRGRTAAVLELGSGFDPEQTGRDNARFYAQLMGMSTSETLEKLPVMEQFADIGPFFDRPMKTYSAGMYSRLAFSVCSHVNADVLMIDEAFSVGDAAFQRRCFHRIREIREHGVTILFATHDTNTVRLMCDVALMLEGGELRAAGDPATVVDQYLSLLLNGDSDSHECQDNGLDRLARGLPKDATPPALNFSPDFLASVPANLRFPSNGRGEVLNNRSAEVTASVILGGKGNVTGALHVGDMCTVRSLIRFREPAARFWFGVLVRDRVGQAIFGHETSNVKLGLPGPFQPGDLIVVDFRFPCDFRQDTYFVSLGLGDRTESVVYFYASDVMELRVEVGDSPVYGVVNLPCEFVTQAVSRESIGLSPDAREQ